MSVPNQRDRDEIEELRNLRRRLDELEQNTVSRWGRVPIVAADPVTPPDGSMWLRTDTGSRHQSAGVTRAPGAGVMGSVTVAVDQTGITAAADLTGFSIPFTAVLGRRYFAHYSLGITQLTAGNNPIIRISEATFGVIAIVSNQNVAAGSTAMATGFWDLGTTWSGAKTFRLRGETGAGTLTIPNASSVNGRFAILDVGI